MWLTPCSFSDSFADGLADVQLPSHPVPPSLKRALESSLQTLERDAKVRTRMSLGDRDVLTLSATSQKYRLLVDDINARAGDEL